MKVSGVITAVNLVPWTLRVERLVLCGMPFFLEGGR